MLEEIESMDETLLPARPIPKPPSFRESASVKSRLKAIQKYISSLEYNYTGVDYFSKKKVSMRRINITCKEIIREALPIKCVEGMFLGAHLTNGMMDIDRVPLRFKSRCGDNVYYHVVLAVHSGESWGALGLSRKSTLMYKGLRFNTLSDLLLEFKTCYEECGHAVVKMCVGQCLPHGGSMQTPILWRALQFYTKHDWNELSGMINTYWTKIHAVGDYYARKGQLPPWFKATFALTTGDNDAEPDDETSKDNPNENSNGNDEQVGEVKEEKVSTEKDGDEDGTESKESNENCADEVHSSNNIAAESDTDKQ